MKTISILLLCSLLTNYSFSQVDKGNWLIGGNGNIKINKQRYDADGIVGFDTKLFSINIKPSLGYFVDDKFVLGLRPNFNWVRFKTFGPPGGPSGVFSNEKRFSIGPFVRYYLLPSENRTNLIVESSYQRGLYSFSPRKGTSNAFSAALGAVLFLNTSVGLELLCGYAISNETIKPNGPYTKNKGLDVNIGFQFYLEKD